MSISTTDLDRLLRLVPGITEGILLLLFAGVVISWFIPDQEQAPELVQIDGQVTGVDVNLDQLLAVHLFGKPGAAPEPEAVAPPKPVRLSPLGIRLLGTVVAGESSAAVIVAQGSGEQRVVVVGKNISPGVKLIEVESGAILIERSGMQERILMEKGAQLHQAAPIRPVPAVQNTPRAMTAPAAPSGDIEIARLMAGIRLLPHYSGNRQDGLLVAALTPGSIWQQSGLANGDLIERVNDIPVSGIQQIIKIGQSLRPGDSVRLRVQRNGQQQSIQVTLPS